MSVPVTTSLWGYGLSNLTNNDPFPLFSTKEPYNFLTNHARWNIMAGDNVPLERLSAAVTAFRQAADKARNFDKERVQLGDIRGRWNMLALTYDPATVLVSNTIRSFLNTDPLQTDPDLVRPDLRPEFTTDEIVTITRECIPLLSDPCNTDTNEKLGFFSVPAKYRKDGIRFDIDMQLTCDCGISLEFGFADIKNQPCDFITECPETVTCNSADGPCVLFEVGCTCLRYVNQELMKKLQQIAKELKLDIDDFQKTGIEDVRIGAYWRHIFISDSSCPDVPCCLFIPFISFEGGIPLPEQRDPRKLFGLPFGNNGHGSVGFVTGFNLVYHTWIEFGSEIGFTHFFPLEVCNLPFPTQELQVGLLPFSVNARIQPGNNWHFGATLTTPYFLPHLSFYAQYLYVNHNRDDVCILQDLRPESVRRDPMRNNFLVKKFERESKWDFQCVNVALNYEFCPEITVGIAWQLPLRGRNVFRSTTVLVSLIGVC